MSLLYWLYTPPYCETKPISENVPKAVVNTDGQCLKIFDFVYFQSNTDRINAKLRKKDSKAILAIY